MDVIAKDYLLSFDLHFKSVFNCYGIWIFSILSSILVGLTGILPIILIPINGNTYISSKNKRLRLLLSFAVGSLLGEAFLHLIPEVCQLSLKSGHSPHSTYYSLGVLVLSGILTFLIIEIVFSHHISANQKYNSHKRRTSNSYKTVILSKNQTQNHTNLCHKENNNFSKTKLNCYKRNNKAIKSSQRESIETFGYLNLLANGIDNFTHGLAITASFISGYKTGFLTTFAIVIHEIPHEISDFAILMKSGFSKWDAMKAQLSTASIGIFGAIFALSFEYINKAQIQIWVLPFTCGGFINIAMVSILPDLLREDDPWESIKQTLLLVCGIGVMALVSSFGH